MSISSNGSFPPKRWSERILNGLNKSRQENRFCDVTIEINGRQFKTHKIVISAASPYFTAMFSNGMKESLESRIVLHDMDHEAFESILHYVYTEELEITNDNVESLLGAASMLQMPTIKDECCEYLMSQLNLSNFAEIAAIADRYSCEKIIETTKQYLKDFFASRTNNFRNLEIQKEFSKMEEDKLICFMENKIWIEEKMCTRLEKLMKWINYSKSRVEYYKQRPTQLDNLMRVIDFHEIDSEILYHILLPDAKECKYPVLRSSERCLNYIKKAIEYKNKVLVELMSDFQPNRPVRRRLCILSFESGQLLEYDSEKERLHLIDGKIPKGSYCQTVASDFGTIFFKNKRIYSIHVYHSEEGLQPDLPLHSNPMRDPGIACHGHHLYTIGGTAHDGAYSNLVRKFSFITKKWDLCSPLNTSRSRPTCVVLGDYIYAFGRLECDYKVRPLKYIERYEVNSNKWKYVKPTRNEVERNDQITVLDGHIYVLHYNKQSIEKYYPSSNTWEYICEPPKYKGKFRSIVGFNGLLYALYTGSWVKERKVRCYMFSYDPAKDVWSGFTKDLFTLTQNDLSSAPPMLAL